MASVRFFYFGCNDLAAMRRFYGELVGLREIYFAEGESLAYDCDGLQFTILQSAVALPMAEEWAAQPGWGGGTGGAASWSVVLDEGEYAAAVRRLLDAEVPRRDEAPQWRGYWGFVVRDPMGNTVELSWPADEAPGTLWSWG